MSYNTPIHRQVANTIKGLSMDAVQKANSGHPGMPMGMADTANVLWSHFLQHDPKDPKWINRDRFVLSAGHGSMLLYSLLHLTGYPKMTMEEIQAFRSWGSLTPGHPENHLTPGVETTTGPLGQGFANAVGMAIAERFLASRYNQPNFDIIDHHTYAIAGDGCLMEGISYEAASLAGHLGLSRLVVLYDDNDISIDGHTDLTFTENVDQRFESCGWAVQAIDGHDPDAVAQALENARAETQRPSLIRCQTHIGHGAPTKQDSSAAHGAPLGDEEIEGAKAGMDWPRDPFHVPEEVRSYFAGKQQEWTGTHQEWTEKMGRYREAHADLAQELDTLTNGGLPDGWAENLPTFEVGTSMATRKASGAVIQAISQSLPTLVGGSADLEGSTNTRIPEDGHMQAGELGVRNIHFGVREHAMGAICNGMALHGGMIPFCATFLQFSDYMRPAVRLAGLMEQRVIYVWTHDSVFLGEDGPTHQPVEHVSALRAIPNLNMFRPGDANEVKWCWKASIEHTEGPSALALTRQNLPILAGTEAGAEEGVAKGAYVLWNAPGEGKTDLLLLATGSEIHLAQQGAEKLLQEGIRARVISMPCWEFFDAQTSQYQESILDPNVPVRVVVEAGRRHGWERYAGPFSGYVTIESFGASAPANVIAEKLGFTADNVASVAQQTLSDFKANAPQWLRSVEASLA